MSISSKQRFELGKFVKELKKHRGRHTELVSVYVPAGYEMTKIIGHLSQEQGTATNIKSATTRKNVIDALERMIQHLRLYTKTPENGLAAFSGNVSEREGQYDFQVWSIEPPVPCNTRIYRCDKVFVTEHLEEMLDIKETYGLIVLDRREGDVAILKGKTIIPLTQSKSNVPGKTRAGGQSAARYGRLREDAAKDFLKKIARMAQDEFLGKENLQGIIIGGPGPTKYDFVEKGYLNQELKNKVIGIKDLSYTGEFGLQELLERSEDILQNEEVMQEKILMQKFFEMLSKNSGTVSYGKEQVMHNVKMGAVETVLLSEAVDDETVEEFEEVAKELGTEVVIISTETREGVQLRDMGKIAAILRYEVAE
jgi:peptide chain release factor subunit 1